MDKSIAHYQLDVDEALSQIDRASPPLEPFRDGRLIDDIPCRFTIGRLALMEIAGCKLFLKEEEREAPLHSFDIFQAWYFSIEKNLDNSVQIADQPDLVFKAVNKLFNRYSKRSREKVIEEFQSWLSDIHDSMPSTEDDEDDDGPRGRTEWWVDAVDTISSQYPWDEEFILWYLPLVRAVKYQETISARIKGESVVDEISDDITNALDSIEEVIENGKS